MDVRQSSSPCSSKKQKLENDNKSLTTIECLPEELILQICSYVASNNTIDTMNLKMVSKKFLQICTDDQVLRCSVYPEYPWTLWYKAPEIKSNYRKYMKSLRNAGNPDALFNAGISNLGDISQNKQNKQKKGLRQVIQAAEGGYTLAQYIAGIALYCWGGEGKQKGIDILTKITKASDSMANTLEEIYAYGRIFRDKCWVRTIYENLKERYEHETMKCTCNGTGSKWFEDYCRSGNGWGNGKDIDSRFICQNLKERYEPETTKCTCNGTGSKWFEDYCRSGNCWGNGKDIDRRLICQVCLTEEIVYQFLPHGY